MKFTSADDALASGFAEDIISQLARDKPLNIISRYSSFHYSDFDYIAAEISEALSARFLVDGRVNSKDGALTATIDVYDAAVDGLLGSFSFNG